MQKMMVKWVGLLLMLVLLGVCSGYLVAAPDGRGVGVVDMLIICGHSEWAFGEQPKLDVKYQQMLKEGGYRVTTVHEWQVLTPEFLRQFHVTVYLNPSAYLGGGYFDYTAWRSGYHLLTVRDNLAVLQQWVRDGGGLFIVPSLEEMGMRGVYSINQLLAPYGMETTCGCVRDPQRAYKAASIGYCGADYPWTEKILQHPVTAGVKRIYYPSYCTRWDDNYTTIPLKAQDDNAWQMLVTAMPGSHTDARRGSIYDDKGTWTALDNWDNPGLFGIREFGKGRVAVTGLSAWHLFYITYAKFGNVTESSFSRVDGIPMTEGDGKTKSDLHLLLENTYQWLAESSVKAGMGGYDAAKGIFPAKEDHLKDETFLSDVWANRDPMVTGVVHPVKILVGARSAVSNGTGSVEEWAKAAKQAGYDVVCFTETFEYFKQEQWNQYVADCKKFSDKTVTLLPGYDIDTDIGNRFLLVGLYQQIRPHLLTQDRKKLFWTGHMVLGMGDILPIAARPQLLATVRGAQGALPPDLYSHLIGIAVATYADNKQVDDGLFAYKWHVNNASMPIPVAVHEVSAPGQLVQASQNGLQNYINSDTPENAAFYFRQGFSNYGGNPSRYYISSGPVVDACSLDNWKAPAWNLSLQAHGTQPISEVIIHDQRGIYRRVTPKSPTVAVRCSGDQSVQRWFMIELRDKQGGKAYTSPIRTLPMYAYARCQDRQNYFGERMTWLTYIGKLPDSAIKINLPGVKLAESVCCKPQMFYAGQLYSIMEYLLDSTYVPSGDIYDYDKQVWAKGGRRERADNAPLFNDMPIPEYAAKIRSIHPRSRSYVAGISPPVFAEEEATITLKQDLPATGNIWPIIGKTLPNAAYSYTDSTGKKTEGKVTTFIDLPAGGWAGDIVALSPLRVGSDGNVGFPPPANGTAKKDTVYKGTFIKIDAGNAPAVLKSMGLNGATPYKIELQKGLINRTVASVYFDADKGAVSGHLTGAVIPGWAPTNWGAVKPAFQQECGVPLRLCGANPRWVAGLWTSRDDKIEPFGFLDGVVLGMLRVDKDADFYFGNMLTASNANLYLAFGAEWTKDAVVIEVQNPTDKKITATVQTAVIPGRIAFKKKVTVPAGGTVYLEKR